MGIEAIGSIGSAMESVASAIGRGVTSVGRISGEIPSAGVVSVSGSSFIVPVFEAAPIGGFLSTIINEGPVGLADLKNTMPLQIGQSNPAEPLSAESAIIEAESILFQAQRPGKNYVPFLSLRDHEVAKQSSTIKRAGSFRPFGLAQGELPRNDELVEPAVVPGKLIHGHTLIRSLKCTGSTENALSDQVEGQSKTRVAQNEQEQEVEEIVEEVLLARNASRSEAGGEEEEVMERRLYLEDQEALVVRKSEVRQAIIKAKVEADRLGLKKIAGWLVAKFLPAEHLGNRSQVLKKKGPDGSYQETVEAIAGIGDFESERKAVERLDEIVAEKKPVKLGKNGTAVRNEDVARVFKYWTTKPVQAHIEVIRRVIKKGVSTIPPGSHLDSRPHYVQDSLGWTEEVQREEIKKETSLEDLGLAEVFPKTA